jgi:hypothetical protein
MATIKLSDNSALTDTATVVDDSVLGKTPAAFIHFLCSDVIGAMGQKLDQVQINSVPVGFSYQPSFSLSGGSAKFTVGGGATGELDLYKPAANGTLNPLFPIDQYGTDIEMKGNYYLALSFQLALTTATTGTAGAFTITSTVGTTASSKLYLPFSADAAGNYPTLKTALEALCGAFTLPQTVGDMKALPAGTVFVYDAKGSVGFKGQVNLLAAVNPTATLGISTSYGPIKIDAGPSLTVGGGVSITGDFQVRLWSKDGNLIQLGYYKKMGTTFSVSFDASAAVDVSLAGYDVIGKIYGLLGDAGKLDPTWLKSHIPASTANDVQSAYQAAVQTKLSIAIDEECDTSVTDQVAFSWNFDASKMDADSQSAFKNAIQGDLSILLSDASLPAGISKIDSVFDRMKTSKHTFTFNFLGLFDYASVQSASLDMSVKASEDGQVVIADKATLTRLNAAATPLVKNDLLRQVLAEDFVATMGYSASFGTFATNLQVNYLYFDYEAHANRSDLQTFVSTAALLATADAPTKDWASILQSGLPSQSASLLASLKYGNADATHLFLDGTGMPLGTENYRATGRHALVATPGLGLNDIFLDFLADDTKWQQLIDAGAIGNFYAVLGVDLVDPPQWATVAYFWTQHVVTWAGAMHSTAQALQNVLQYVAKNPGIYPLHDPTFLKLRQTFASQLKTAVQQTPLFNDALGIITIYLAAPPTSETVTINYAGKSTTYLSGNEA